MNARRRARTGRFAFCLLLLLSVSLRGLPALAEDYASRFDRMDRRLNNGRGESDILNNTGTLAWGEGFILQAYVEMYRATGDTAYLDKLVEQFERVLGNRDDVRRTVDVYRHVPLAGWGADEYSRGKWHVWAAHTGIICQGPMDFIAVVKAQQRLKKPFGATAATFLERIKECVAAHDPEWRNGPGAGEGYYQDPGIGPLPLNQQNALGLVMLDLYLVTRDHVYKDRVTRLATYFKNRLRKRPDGSYDWAYWPKPEGNATDSEDISHAAINIDFAVHCRQAHIVFNEGDLAALGKTWTAHVRRGQGEWSDTVGGGGGSNTYVPQAIGRWLDLSPHCKDLLSDARSAFERLDEDHASGVNLLGLAELARYSKEINRRKRTFIRLPRIKL